MTVDFAIPSWAAMWLGRSPTAAKRATRSRVRHERAPDGTLVATLPLPARAAARNAGREAPATDCAYLEVDNGDLVAVDSGASSDRRFIEDVVAVSRRAPQAPRLTGCARWSGDLRPTTEVFTGRTGELPRLAPKRNDNATRTSLPVGVHRGVAALTGDAVTRRPDRRRPALHAHAVSHPRKPTRRPSAAVRSLTLRPRLVATPRLPPLTEARALPATRDRSRRKASGPSPTRQVTAPVCRRASR